MCIRDRVRLLTYPCPPRDGHQPNVSSRRVRVMELLHPQCAGIDISKRDAKVCVRIAGSGRRRAAETVTTWSSMTNQVLALRDHLTRERVTCVVLEAASDYWDSFYYLLEDASFEVMLVNPRHVKNLPGRKDVSCLLYTSEAADDL